MARWKLATAHYLNTVIAWQWEYMEIDRKTGRPNRTRFNVPRLMNPADKADWTSSWGPQGAEEGEIIVCQPGKGAANDIEFLGDPTPDMIPMDDEAKAISARFEAHWSYKPDADQPGGYSQALIDTFDNMKVAVDVKPVEIPGMDALIAAITAQSQMIGQLVALQAAPKPTSSILNR